MTTSANSNKWWSTCWAFKLIAKCYGKLEIVGQTQGENLGSKQRQTQANKRKKIELKAKSAFGLKVPLRLNIKPTQFQGHLRKSQVDFFL